MVAANAEGEANRVSSTASTVRLANHRECVIEFVFIGVGIELERDNKEQNQIVFIWEV